MDGNYVLPQIFTFQTHLHIDCLINSNFDRLETFGCQQDTKGSQTGEKLV